MLVPPVFAIPENCEFTLILSLPPHPIPIFRTILLTSVITLSGCWSELKERSYDAPKIESEFVKGREPQPRRSVAPMMGASRIPLEDRRILGAVIPDAGNVYFIKATDRIARLSLVELTFRSIVERFAVDALGSPKMELTPGWSLRLLDNANAGIGLAEMVAEINFETDGGPIRFTVSKYNRPSEQGKWDEYLLSQINRWRGQLELPPIDISDLYKKLPTIVRDGASLPAYIFDAKGSGEGKPTTTAPSKVGPNEQATNAPASAKSRSPLNLVYDIPEGWELQPAKPYREATFKVTENSKEGEVTVSSARDSPVQNAAMWIGQVLPNSDPATLEALANKAVEEAETFQAGTRTGKLYSIRSSDQADAKSLLVVAIPMDNGGMSMFVKLNSELRMMEEVKSTFLSFVNSLHWE